MLSPWIRRALIAGGFGIGTSSVNLPHEFASVVPYRGGNRDDFTTNENYHPDDSEAQGIKHDHSSRGSSTGDHLNSTDKAPLYAVETPFIHFDLTRAVNAAERSLTGTPATHEEDVKA